jgi:hypothetical protein
MLFALFALGLRENIQDGLSDFAEWHNNLLCIILCHVK